MPKNLQAYKTRGRIALVAAILLAIACIVLAVLLVNEKGYVAQLERQNAEYEKELAAYKEKVAQFEKDVKAFEVKLAEAKAGSGNAGTRVVTEYVYVYVEPEPEPKPDPDPEPVDTGNITYQSDVTSAMATSDFWISRAKDPDAMMADSTQIANMNAAALAEPATQMFDLAHMGLGVDVARQKEALANEQIPSVNLCRNGEWMSPEEKDAFFQAMRENILAGRAAGASGDTGCYGVITQRADMHSWPTADYIGYEPGDWDDELISSSLNVAEPFVAMLVTADGRFCWGYGTNCAGWIETSKIAWCSDKDEWLAEWDFDLNGRDFLVVTESRITLEPSITDVSSELQLMLGTRVRLVPEGELPASIYERNTWHNYVVSLPVRTADGTLGHMYGLIPQTANVHVGYVPLTQRNLLDVSFACLGSRYGWGGQYGAMDCSLFVCSIYRCFGYELPRNTNWQICLPSKNIAIDGAMGHAERVALLNSLTPGTLLEFDGHIVMYVGSYEGTPYVINDLGSVYDSSEPKTFSWVYNICLCSTDVQRGSAAENGGYTWTDWFRIAVRPWLAQ